MTPVFAESKDPSFTEKNEGGDDFALTSIEWLMRGVGYLRFDSRLTKRDKTKNAPFDMNFDGKFDENDVSPYTDYN